MYSVDRECRYQFMNRAHLLRLDVSLGEVIGRSYGEFHSGENTIRFADRIAAVFETGNALQTEHRSERDNKYFLRTFSPVKDLQGNITGVTVISKDITERKQAEEALRASEKKYRQIVENSRDIIFTLGSSGEFIYLSPSISNVLGYDQSELIGHKFHSLVHPEDLPAVLDVIQRNLEEGFRTPGTKYRVRHASGEWRWYTARINTVRDEKGNFLNITGVAQDITRRKQAEESLKESEEKYRTILENIEDGYYEVDLAGNFTFFNDAFTRIHEYSRDEMMGMNYREYADAENAKLLYQDFNRVYRTGEPSKGLSCEVFTKKGAMKGVEASISLIKDLSGTPIGFRGIARDITARKQVEKEIEDLARFPQEDPNPVLRVEPDGLIIYANEASKPLLFDWNTDVGNYLPTSLCKRVADTVAGKTKITVDISCGELVFLVMFSSTREGGYVNIYGRDITERKRLEEILKKDQQELKLIVDSSPVMVFYKDKKGEFIRVNKTFTEAFEVPEEELVGKTVFDLFSAKIAQGMTNDDQEVIKSGHPKINIIEQYESASGLRWVQTDKIPICDKNGIPFGLIGFAQDITERKKAEEALQESENRYRALSTVRWIAFTYMTLMVGF